EILPAVFDPEAAMRPEAPLLHEKGISAYGNVYADIHGEVGNTAEGFAAADVVHEGVYSTPRVQHVHLETHGSIAWTAPDGRVHVRTSSQAPFIAQQKLCHIFGLRPRDVHVFTERVGGGFGGKQEMLTEDLCVLATMQTGRPLSWLWLLADNLCHRMRDRRSGKKARFGPVREPPPQHDPPRRLDRIDLGRSIGCRFRQLRVGPMHGPGRRRAREWARPAQAGRRGMGRGYGFCTRHARMRAADRAPFRCRDADAGRRALSFGSRLDGYGQCVSHLASA